MIGANPYEYLPRCSPKEKIDMKNLLLNTLMATLICGTMFSVFLAIEWIGRNFGVASIFLICIALVTAAISFARFVTKDSEEDFDA